MSNDNKIKPYSSDDYLEANEIGLDLDDWNDYKLFFKLEEYAEDRSDHDDQ